MRYLHSDRKCPVCKATNETLIVDVDSPAVVSTDADDGEAVHHKRFGDYRLWGNDLGGGFVYRDDVGMHFPNELHERDVVPLLGYGCGMPNCEFDNWGDSYVDEREGRCHGKDEQQRQQQQQRGTKKRLAGLKALKAHLRADHGYALCDLCVTNKRDFVSKLARYTPRGLKSHQSRGDGDLSGFTGHPLCEFCKPLRFYDIVALHEHLNREHYKCHICDKLGKRNQFFKDYPRLERHFDREHFLCHDPQCVAARFVVFENEIDLRAHESSVHGTGRGDGGTKIKLEFRVRREGEREFANQSVPTGDDFGFGLNGEAFVPEALPDERAATTALRQANEPVISHPAHAARTAELRAHAAMVRERDGASATAASGHGDRGSDEAFPALAGESSSGMLVGWTADGARTAAGGAGGLRKTPVGAVTQEEFPSLGPATSADRRYDIVGGRPGARGKKKAHAPVANFSSVASRPTATPFFGTPSAAANSVPGMTRNNYPSLGGASTAPNMNANNFPSLGGSTGTASSGNPYAPVQAHARKLNAGRAPGSALSNADFPPPPSSKKATGVKAAFAPKKPPPMDNVLQFPPPSTTTTLQQSSNNRQSAQTAESLKAGKETVDSLKQILGSVRYKKLKSLTKDFAIDSITPDAYVEEAASLFDKGLGDVAFWDHIPLLIRDMPNTSTVNRAMSHLESLRVVNQMQEFEFNTSNADDSKKKPINYILPAKKKTSSWGNSGGNSGIPGRQSSTAAIVATTATTKNGEAPKGTSNATKNNGGSRKSKAKKKNNELRALAFGS